MGESEEELMSLLMKVKEESEKFGLKLSILKTTIDGEIMETVTDFIFLGSKITGAIVTPCMVTAAMKLKDAFSLEEKLCPT